MRKFLLLTVPFAAIVLAQCVSGDDSNVGPDAGVDATQSDVANDNTQPLNDGGITDADAATPPPTPDGSLVWLNHFNNNTSPGGIAFSDIAVNENGGLSFLPVGEFRTDPSAGNTYHFGTLNLGPSTTLDFVAGGLSATGSSVWAKSLTGTDGGGANQHYDSVVVDSQGNLYVFGGTDSVATLKDPIVGPTSFIVKLSATGTPIWEHLYSSAGAQIEGPARLALANGNLVMATSFYQSITYDPSTTLSDDAAGDTNCFVTELDTTTGATKWVTSFGSPNPDFVNSLAPTPDGSVIVAGAMSGTMTGDGPAFPLSMRGDAGTGYDLFVVKIDSTGKSVYGLAYGDVPGITATGVAYENGTIAVSVIFFQPIDFGKGVVTPMGTDGVVFTINETTKNTNFVAQLSGSATDEFLTVAMDQWGEVIAAGIYGDSNASAQIGAQALPQSSISTGAMVIAKWDSSGTLLWAHGYVPTLDGGAPPYTVSSNANVHNSIVPSRVQTTSTGEIVMSGTMVGGTDFGKGYQGSVSTIEYTRCTCTFGCLSTCFMVNPPACCSTAIVGNVSDGIVGTWNP